MSEWQKIDTAPTDGTDILGIWLQNNNLVFGVVWFEGDDWHEYDYEVVVSPPTHWMPLPEPPK